MPVVDFVPEAPPKDERLGIGGNNPPPEEQVRADFHEAMLEKHPAYEQRVDDLLAAATRAVIEDQDAAGKSADLVRSIRAMDGAVADVHKAVKAPYWEAGKVADALKNALSTKLAEAQKTIQGKQTEFLRKEQARQDAERREREAAARREAEAAAEAERQRLAAESAGDVEAMAEVEVVAAPAVVERKPEPIRSTDTGAAVSGRKEWQCVVDDYSVAVIDMLDDDKVKEAIDACAKRRVRAGIRKIEGVRIWEAIVARSY